MHKVPGKRKVSYGSEPAAPESPDALLNEATAEDSVLTPPVLAPDLGDMISVQDSPPSQNAEISQSLAKFHAVKTQLLRSHSRYLVKWEVVLIHELGGEKLTYYGKINDISENGLSMFCEFNVFFNGRVSIIMTLPPLNVGLKAQKIEVESRMVYTILSQYSFRLGLEFLNFRDGEKKILMDRLESSNAALRPGIA
ncbi:PilZ domain-containing protein [Undibacterium sp. TJN19]|uniref:PilZ domain-containing protein n=1 Tax=Undibacterium sp. TJN19 TaxID=3413055 RepID=UPI003BF140F2